MRVFDSVKRKTEMELPFPTAFTDSQEMIKENIPSDTDAVEVSTEDAKARDD